MLQEGIAAAGWEEREGPSAVEVGIELDEVVMRLAAPEETTVEVLALGEIGEKSGGNSKGVSEFLGCSRLSEKVPWC